MALPRLLVCGFDAFPDAPVNPSAAVVRALAAEGWSPTGAALDCEAIPVAWSGSVEAILQRGAYDGVLVVGVAVEAEAFRVETLGRNRADPDRPDHGGARWPTLEIDPAGPPALPATAPVEAILARLAAAGVAADFSDDAGAYLCNFTLYGLLAAQAAPAVGFLHVPQARECAANARFTLADIDRAVRLSLDAFAEALASRVELLDAVEP